MDAKPCWHGATHPLVAAGPALFLYPPTNTHNVLFLHGTCVRPWQRAFKSATGLANADITIPPSVTDIYTVKPDLPSLPLL